MAGEPKVHPAQRWYCELLPEGCILSLQEFAECIDVSTVVIYRMFDKRPPARPITKRRWTKRINDFREEHDAEPLTEEEIFKPIYEHHQQEEG